VAFDAVVSSSPQQTDEQDGFNGCLQQGETNNSEGHGDVYLPSVPATDGDEASLGQPESTQRLELPVRDAGMPRPSLVADLQGKWFRRRRRKEITLRIFGTSYELTIEGKTSMAFYSCDEMVLL